MRRSSRHLIAGLALALGLMSQQANAQVHSSLVYPGPDGKLVYAGYANQNQASAGNRMIDFSSAGYMGGGVSIPWVPEVITLDPLPSGDDRSRIQAAINQISALPLSPSGFRGALLLRAGTYRVSSTLSIGASGVVIRGEGQHTGGTFIQYTSTAKSTAFNFLGTADRGEIPGTRSQITTPLVPSGTRTFEVASTATYSVGDRVVVLRTPNQAWINMLNMAIFNWTPEAYQMGTTHVITAIAGNTITLDTPLAHALEQIHGGASMYRYQFNGALRHVGIENLRIESSYASAIDMNHGWDAIVFDRVENAWARRITAKHFAFSLVNVKRNSQFITVEDCAQLDPKSELVGGARYSFNLEQASHVLMQRCFAREGRHDFVTSARVCGPNAFVDCFAEVTYDDAGPHHRYAIGLLFDNVRAGKLHVQNRQGSGSGHGWAGAQTVFWNSVADSLICDAPKAAMNFAIGCVGNRRSGGGEEPPGIWQSHNTHVTPRSLYYKQLEDRLGTRALMNVITSSQRTGNIWSQLNAWKGATAVSWLPSFGPLRVDSGGNLYPRPQTPVSLGAIVRCPLPSDFLTTYTWRKLSGPGNVTFDNPNNLYATAEFSTNGLYTLEIEVIQTKGAQSFTGSAILTVAAGNTPVANVQSVTATEDVAKPITLTGTDADGDSLTYAIVTPPPNGTLSGTPPNVTYTPKADYNGSDSFTFKVTDPLGASAQAVVSITVTPVNDAPVVSITAPANGAKYVFPAPIEITASASDVDGTVTKVEFYNGNTLLETDTTSPYSYSWQSVPAGSYALTAKATDNHGAVKTSAPASILVRSTDPVYSIRPDGKTVVTFTYGSSTWTVPYGVTSAEILVIGGGGSGAAGGTWGADGGGGGGLTYYSNYNLVGGSSVSFAVGEGGAARSSNGAGNNGNPSSFGLLTAAGGEGGLNSRGGNSGGLNLNGVITSGGLGATHAGSNGGGGAGQDGTGANGSCPGGNGIQINITGTNTYYAGGGGGGYQGAGGLGGGGRGNFLSGAGQNGVNGLGGGGGASRDNPISGAGGDGIVIIAYQASSNTPPVANAQSVSTPPNIAKSIVLTAADAESDPLTFVIVTPPAHGEISGTLPNITYTPEQNFQGADSFTFKANDGAMDSGVVTVNVLVGLFIENFSFEMPVQITPSYTYRPTDSTWSFSSGAGIARNGSPWYGAIAPNGTQAGFLQNTGARISQIVNFPAAGTYTIHFSAIGRAVFGSMPLQVQIDGSSVLSLTASQINTATWTDFASASFSVSAGDHTIAFVNGTLAGDHATAIDNVRLVAQFGYSDWAGPSGHNLVGGQQGDDDGDGASNFTEYAFGLDPTNAASSQPITDVSETKTAGIFSYTRRSNSGLRYTVWTSLDLQTWTEQTDAIHVPGTSIAGVETVEVNLGEIPTTDSLFIRVQAQ